MKLIKAAAIGDAQLIASNVVETPPPAYNGATTYAAGDMAGVTVGSVITVYEAQAARNLLARSIEFDNASWAKQVATVTANAATDPLGGTTADKVIINNTIVLGPTTAAGVKQQITKTSAAPLSYTLSVYAKAAEFNRVALFLVNPGLTASARALFSLVDGTQIGAISSGGGFANFVVSSENVGSGWWRLRFTATTDADAALLGWFWLEDSVATTGNGTSGIYLWGAQLEAGSTLGTYQATAATAGVNLANAPASSPGWWQERSVTNPLYVPGTAYAIGDRVISTTTHRVYQGLQAANTGHDPTTSPTWWQDIGPTNKYAAFDAKVGTLVSRVGSITYTIVPGSADALGILDTNAESVTLAIKVGAAQMYSATKYLNVSGALLANWYDYFTAAVGTKTNIDFENLPLYAGANWLVTITGRNTGSYVSAGTVAVGAARSLGKTEAHAKVAIIDFSQKTTDAFGIVSATERGFSKKMTLRTLIDTNDVDAVVAALTAVRAVPTIYLGETGFDSLLAYGYWNDFEIDVADGRMDASGQLYDGTKSFLSMTVTSMSTSL